METKAIASRVYCAIVDVNIEEGTKNVNHESVINLHNEFGTMWRVEFTMSPKQSQITVKSEPNSWRIGFETYQLVCSVLHYAATDSFAPVVLQGHAVKVAKTRFFDWDVVEKIQKDGASMKIRFDFIDTSRNEIDADDCAMLKQMRTLPYFESGELSDFLIKTSKKDFKVHKIVLASRSPVFEAMFRSKMREAKTGVVSIKNVRTVVMEELLRFMYADVAANLSEMPCELFAAANLYGVQDLERLCVKHMSTHMCLENVTGILNLCDRYLLAEPAREAALKFIRDNEEAIVKREEYLIYLMETVKIENVVDRLKLVQDYDLPELKQLLLDFVATNYKDVMQIKDYREMYFNKLGVNIVLEIDEYISNYSNKVTEFVAPAQSSIKGFLFDPVLLLFMILVYHTFA